MAISNELSSEIAAAILAEKKSPQELRELRDVILRVHSELQKMSAEERASRLRGEDNPPTAAKSQVNQ
jgi:predicted transcriptional regulator